MDIVKTLNRSVKRNPFLLEEAMPTADKIVQSAAWLLVNDKAPAALRHARIIQMDVAAMTENIVYQGEFAERVRDFIKDASQESDLTLFINGIHAIIGSSSILVDMSEAASALKLALRQGTLRCIGAASLLEFERYIGENPDWRNLFTPLEIGNSASIDAVEGAGVIELPRISEAFQQPDELPASVTPPSFLSTRALEETGASPTQALQTALDTRLDTLQTRLTRFGLQVHFSAAAMAILRRLEENSDAFEAEFAARVENPLGGMLLRGEIDYGQNVLVDASGGELVFQTGVERHTP
jgi:ATP-dependent Clp protease ATP-binding subunit ClpA